MATDAEDAAEDAAEEIGENRPVRWLARCGLVAYGLVHALVGLLALRMAYGGGDHDGADVSGAMKTVAQQPGGAVLLWLVAVGLLALALWQASDGVRGAAAASGTRRVWKAIASGGGAMVYAVLGGSAVSIALGSGSSASRTQQQATSGVLALPGGQVIVAVVGAGVAAAGIGLVVKGLRVSIGDEIDLSSMSPTTRSIAERLGQFGYVAKGVAVSTVGGLLSYAALAFDRQHVQGLDGALQTILAQPLGRPLLTAVALGFEAFALYAVLEARFRRI